MRRPLAVFTKLSNFFDAQSVPALRAHERDRATQRVVVCGTVVAIWCVESWLGRFNRPECFVALAFSVAYFLTSLVYRSRGVGESLTSRVLLYGFLIVDPVYLIGALAVDPQTFALLHPFVLVVVIRSGIRYGLRTMYLAWAASLLATPLLWINVFWRTEIELTLSFCSMLLLLPLFFASLIRRVHHVRAVEEERARVVAIQEHMTARSAFLARVSHELRSPLQGIVSALDVLELRPARPGDEEIIARLRRSSLMMNTHLRDLLTLARGEAGRLEMRPEPFEACALVDSIVAAAEPLAVAKGLHLIVRVPSDAIFVVADSARIDQILTNLVINSIRYTEVGQVRIALEPYDPSTRLLRFRVADTGPGIPAGVLPTLLEPDRAHTGAERRGEGSGIGLAIVRTLLDHLGGKVSVSSRMDQGTTFTIDIPAEPAPDAQEVERNGDSERVLVVDDRDDVLEAIVSVVDELGFECDRAPSAAVAANLLASRAYGVVLVDLEMPIKGGVELATDIRRGHGPNRDTRFVAMSASPVGQDVCAHFDANLAKPIDQNALRHVLVRTTPTSRPSQPGLWTEASQPPEASSGRVGAAIGRLR